MKKLLTILFVVLMVMSLAACGNKEQEEPLVDPAPTAANTYADFVAAEDNAELELLMSVQAHQGWWESNGQGVVTVYAQNDDGGFFCYNMAADEATANALTEGTLIRVKGYKSTWDGEKELVDATCEIIAGGYDGKVYEAADITSLLGKDEEIIKYMNQKIALNGLEVVAVSRKDDEYDKDIYVTAKSGDAQVELCVENYLTGPDTETWKIADGLAVGDKIDIVGFLYWWNGPNPHVYTITKK